MVFLDYQVQNFNVRNGNQINYAIPYKCLIHVGRINADDDIPASLILVSPSGIPSEGITSYQHSLISNASIGGSTATGSPSSVVAKVGDTLVADGDECDIEVHIFRLPESP